MPLIEYRLDFSSPLSPMKAMHGVNNLSVVGGVENSFSLYRNAGVPYVRFNEIGGLFGGGVFLDVDNLFPNFNADPDDETAYDFTYTDHLMTSCFDAGCIPIFRLGSSPEYAVISDKMPPRRIFPPKDDEKYAAICTHIVGHYTDGWANGYHYADILWEIGNEPDFHHIPKRNPMWQGTPEEFYALYCAVASKIKTAFPSVKVGGFGSYALTPSDPSAFWRASCRSESENTAIFSPSVHLYAWDFFKDFLTYIKACGNVALDFFSFHSYGDGKETYFLADRFRRELDARGFAETELVLSAFPIDAKRRGTSERAADAAAMMIAMQNSPTSVMTYADGRENDRFGELVDPMTHTPFKAYYAYLAYDKLYRLGYQYTVAPADMGWESNLFGDPIQPSEDILALAAGNADATARAVLFVNTGRKLLSLSSPEGAWVLHLLDKRYDLNPIRNLNTGDSFNLPASSVALLTYHFGKETNP